MRKTSDVLAVVLNQVGNIPVINPFFLRHLTEIAPGRTVVLSFTPYDEGLNALHCPALEVERSKPHLRFKLSAFRWGWNLLAHGYHEALPLRDVENIAAFFAKNHVTVVMAEDGPNGCAVLPACRKTGIPLYTHFHGNDIGVGERRWECRASYRYLAKHGTGAISSSRYLAEKLKAVGFPEARIHIVPGGVGIEEYTPSDADDNHNEYLLVTTARFIPKKAPHRMLETLAEVLVDYPDTTLEWIGDGPLREHSIRYARELGIEGHVIFNNEETHYRYFRERLKHATVYCQHSVTAPHGDTEAFGLAPVDAMACGVPVIVTRHNGFVETVVDGVTGFLTPEHDVHAMAAAIKKLFADPQLRQTMGKVARQRVVEKFSAERHIQNLRTLLLQEERHTREEKFYAISDDSR